MTLVCSEGLMVTVAAAGIQAQLSWQLRWATCLQWLCALAHQLARHRWQPGAPAPCV